jgi:transcriptional regulator with XRE-family HTH domain
MARKFSELLQEMSPEQRQKIKDRTAEIRKEYTVARNIREIRKALEMTQVEMAEQLHIKQAAVSKIESQTDMYLSTLRRVIEALGGRLHITASFPGDLQFEIDQFSSQVNPIESQAGQR